MENSGAEQGMTSNLVMLLTFFLVKYEDGYTNHSILLLFSLNISVSIIWDRTVLNHMLCLPGKCLLFSAPEARA